MPSDADGSEVPRKRRWRRRWTVRLVLIAALMLIVTLFASANYVPVEVRLLFWEGEVRLAWALLVASFVGFILAVAAMRLSR
ncbi:MAG: lipopolysaccharide assembly protein LapA domain-containing protein [Thermomicrobiales bacterium]